MQLTQLTLANYRNYSRQTLALPSGPTLIQGNNAQGKTNLLEAVAFLSTTRSIHARTDQQLVNWLVWQDGILPFARVSAQVQTAHEALEVSITIVREGEQLKKTHQLNGVKKRAMDVIGKLTTVLFLPADIELVTGSPSIRRRYLDSTLCQISPIYCRTLSRYNKVLNQRNALLKELFKRRGSTDQLWFWDEQLSQHAAHLIMERHQTLLTLDALGRPHHRALSSGQEHLRLCYVPSFDLYQRPKPNLDLPLREEELAPYNSTVPSETELQQQLLAALQQRHAEEIKRGVTTIGPHRDDFLFLVDGVDMNHYGSRGQQRTAALSIKLAEIGLMEQRTNDKPVLLLDDVMSELDAQRRTRILELVDQAGQALLTTTDWEDYGADFRQRAHLLQVTRGRVSGMDMRRK